MKFVDTHAHLYDEQFSNDIENTINRAINSGVDKILLPNVDVETLTPMFELSNNRGCFYPMLGLHPTSVDSNYENSLSIIESYLDKVKICAIGEVGIDLYWDRTFLEEQIIVFKKQIQWALDRNLPLVIHTRKSFDESLASLKKFDVKKYKGVFHCFGGDLNQAKKIIDMGFKIGIGGVVTFKNAKLADIVKEIDLKDILLETDAPYLAPTPHRGEKNESSYIPIIAQKIADIKNTSIENVAKVTTRTATEIFNL